MQAMYSLWVGKILRKVAESKTGIEGRNFCKRPNTEGSFKLKIHNSAFQADVVFITEGTKYA